MTEQLTERFEYPSKEKAINDISWSLYWSNVKAAFNDLGDWPFPCDTEPVRCFSCSIRLDIHFQWEVFWPARLMLRMMKIENWKMKRLFEIFWKFIPSGTWNGGEGHINSDYIPSVDRRRLRSGDELDVVVFYDILGGNDLNQRSICRVRYCQISFAGFYLPRVFFWLVDVLMKVSSWNPFLMKLGFRICKQARQETS